MVGIKDFEMPKCCGECPFIFYGEIEDSCVLAGVNYGHLLNSDYDLCEEVMANSRHPDCPLVEVSEPEFIFYGDNRPIAKFKKEYPDVKEDQDAED